MSPDIKKSDISESSHLSFCKTIDEAMKSDLAHYLKDAIIVPDSTLLKSNQDVADSILSLFTDDKGWADISKLDRVIIIALLEKNKKSIEKKLSTRYNTSQVFLDQNDVGQSAHSGMIALGSSAQNGNSLSIDPLIQAMKNNFLYVETKDKPQEFVDFEKAWLDKVRDFPTEVNFGEMTLGSTTIPVFNKKLNDFAGGGKDEDQIKKEYETAVKNEIKQRMDLWTQNYVSYTSNYKGTGSHGIVIRNSSINAKLNGGNPIVLYALNNKGYIDNKVKHLGGVNSSSATTYKDFITGEEKVEFYRRNFTDKNYKTLDSTQPSTWLDADMHGANDIAHRNLLKPIIQDISQDGLFQGFPDRDDRASMIAQDCGIPYANDKDKKFGFMALQYLINQGYWFWSKQTAGSDTSPFVFLDVDDRWLNQSDDDYCALCAVDYLDRQ